jgi:hypothetical protein
VAPAAEARLATEQRRPGAAAVACLTGAPLSQRVMAERFGIPAAALPAHLSR